MDHSAAKSRALGLSRKSLNGEAPLLGRDEVIASLEDLGRQGYTVLVYGPLGIGKTSVLVELARRSQRKRRPCAFCPRTEHLAEVTAALARCYPEAATPRLQRHRRSRLRLAVEDHPGLLLLDDFIYVGTALKGYLRSLRGTGLGVIIAADVDQPRDHVRLRQHGLAFRELALPPLRGSVMGRLLERELAKRTLPSPLAQEDRDALIRAAQGRPGWIARLVAGATEIRYWHESRLAVDVLVADVLIEVARHYGARARGSYARRR
jgi:hypothetical protein